MGLLNAERIVNDVLRLVNAQDQATFVELARHAPLVYQQCAGVPVPLAGCSRSLSSETKVLRQCSIRQTAVTSAPIATAMAAI